VDIRLHDVRSSNIKAIGFDVQSSTLRIAFHATADVYDYASVPQSVYSLFLASPSKGEFFREHIVGKFKFTKTNPKRERIMSKKQAKPAVQSQPSAAPAPPPTPAATVAAPIPATPSKQEVTITKLRDAWTEKKVDLSKMTITDDGKFKLIVVDAGWPTVQIGASGGITVLELKSYASVPQSVYSLLLASPSMGEFFREHIKDHYRFRKINPVKERITMKKQAATAKPATQPQPAPAAPAPAPTPAAATVAAPTPAQPSKQEATIAKLKDAWIERKVDLSKMQVKQDGKFVLITVADGWPVVQIGASGGIVLPEIRSYPKAFDAAVDGLAVYTKQKERDAKKATTVAVAPTPTPAQPKAETPAAKKAKAHAQLEQTLSA
jgi:uncharacterized coiled-coil protein SlyX